MAEVTQKAIEAYRLLFPKSEPNSFDERLKFQKTVYLLKVFGINFADLAFTWYKRGPFCFHLMEASLSLRNHHEGNLTTEEKNKILENKTKIVELMGEPSKAELYSSIAYLYKDNKLPDEEIVIHMGLVKPWFKREDVENAISKIKSFLSN